MSLLPPNYEEEINAISKGLFISGILVGASVASLVLVLCWGFGLFDVH